MDGIGGQCGILNILRKLVINPQHHDVGVDVCQPWQSYLLVQPFYPTGILKIIFRLWKTHAKTNKLASNRSDITAWRESGRKLGFCIVSWFQEAAF